MLHQLANVAPQAALLAVALISGVVLAVDLMQSGRHREPPIGPIVDRGELVDSTPLGVLGRRGYAERGEK